MRRVVIGELPATRNPRQSVRFALSPFLVLLLLLSHSSSSSPLLPRSSSLFPIYVILPDYVVLGFVS
ncbi:uncharacterized protein EURHEDRAFT_408730 [Aspergillus ruber CBS 135680]|uniref:Uncharacterized protein n=1 Tax=Aspergillus ruber (strain CBS 135680) TaxID=1388766 RepID=A0A017SN56_ASPRC|nr:uncharacterized protein EURHEDRAFT_408730 [Aspergillus ruber CBS 135680]EYE98392.1 hypothetical protein EURHEDRAFT_408730 [Aspergillus ruber CBS 135680]